MSTQDIESTFVTETGREDDDATTWVGEGVHGSGGAGTGAHG